MSQGVYFFLDANGNILIDKDGASLGEAITLTPPVVPVAAPATGMRESSLALGGVLTVPEYALMQALRRQRRGSHDDMEQWLEQKAREVAERRRRRRRNEAVVLS